MHAVAPLIDESSGESPLTVEYPGNGVVRFNAAIRVAIKRYNHAVTWATRHFISLISISKKYESNFKEISKLHLLVVIYECTSGQRKHRISIPYSNQTFKKPSRDPNLMCEQECLIWWLCNICQQNKYLIKNIDKHLQSKIIIIIPPCIWYRCCVFWGLWSIWWLTCPSTWTDIGKLYPFYVSEINNIQFNTNCMEFWWQPCLL